MGNKVKIVYTYTIYPSNKHRFMSLLESEIFDLQYRNTYLDDAVKRQLEECPDSLPVGKTLEIEINQLRIEELQKMLRRMQPKK